MTSELQQKQQDFFYSFLKAKVIYSVILSVCLCVFCEAWLVKTVSHYSNDGHFPYLAYGFNILRKEIPIVLVEVEGHVRSPEVIKRKTCKQVVIRSAVRISYLTFGSTTVRKWTMLFWKSSKVIWRRRRWNLKIGYKHDISRLQWRTLFILVNIYLSYWG